MTSNEPTNRRLLLTSRPQGLPQRSDFEVDEQPRAQAGEGELAAEVRFVSLDPAMRGWMREGRSYIAPVALGEVMRAQGVAEVTESRDPRFAPGDHVLGVFGVQEHVVAKADGLLKVDPQKAPTSLGALGMPGMTAYFGLLDVGAAKEGDTVVVSGAAGAVGTVVGQLAKARGCRAIGIAGGPEKCALLRDLGFDAAIDYKGEDVAAALRTHAPDGMDVYFDNVGGEILDAALTRLARGARVVICGAISQYNAEGRPRGPANYLSLLVSRARMQGFVVFDYADRYAEAAGELQGLIDDGRLRTIEDVVDGTIGDFPDVLGRLFRGENTGKLVLRLSR